MPRMRKKKEEKPEAAPVGGEAKRITPVDIQQREFGLAFRGYNERDVDQFLDEVTEEVARLYAENKRLREEVEFTRTSRLNLGDAEEAEAILRRAREEASRLLAEARARASAVDPGAGVPAGRGTAAALAPFVAQEREFLQSLANLIQTHAEAVKDQIRQARDAAAHAAAREASTQAAAREAAAREAAARAALQEEAQAQAAFRYASSRAAPDDSSNDVDIEEDPGPLTQPWAPEELQSPESPESPDWKEYYPSEEEEEEHSEARPRTGDEILDLTEASRDRSGVRSGGEEEEEEAEAGQRYLEPQRAAREADQPEEDSLEDRSIRELFWGEDY
jgi:cell division initiation protein